MVTIQHVGEKKQFCNKIQFIAKDVVTKLEMKKQHNDTRKKCENYQHYKKVASEETPFYFIHYSLHFYDFYDHIKL